MTIQVSRRSFLKKAGVLSIPATSKILFLSTTGFISSVFAEAGNKLSALEIKTLLQIIKQMFPHTKLNDFHYQSVLEKLMKESTENSETSMMISDGIKKLNSSVEATMTKNTWLESDKKEQMTALEKNSDSDFFGKLKSTTILTLYNNHAVWKQVGYEGESFSKGGYLGRGFDDLDWLPSPPEEASPSMSGGASE